MASDSESPFYVPFFLHFLGGMVHKHPKFWLWWARRESAMLAEKLASVRVERPVYICGLARSGSTVLHEIISTHSDVGTHRVKDFPMLFTPYWWRRASAKQSVQAPRERAHGDRVMITLDSPDALEEMLWMAFFPRCHDPAISNMLGREDKHPAFESFYKTHIRKLLLAEMKTRYAAKANYHIARLPYLARLFPDARFIIPVRAPATHIESLLRQQQIFSQGQRAHPRSLAYMQRSGHFEFGLDRRPINLGDTECVRRIIDAWNAGEEVRGLAMYWGMVHAYLARLLAGDERLREAALVVRYESFCDKPAETLRAVFAHCALGDAEAVIEKHAPGIRAPGYYQSRLSETDRAIIREETVNAAAQWGY
jgi:hypothetical protein